MRLEYLIGTILVPILPHNKNKYMGHFNWITVFSFRTSGIANQSCKYGCLNFLFFSGFFFFPPPHSVCCNLQSYTFKVIYRSPKVILECFVLVYTGRESSVLMFTDNISWQPLVLTSSTVCRLFVVKLNINVFSEIHLGLSKKVTQQLFHLSSHQTLSVFYQNISTAFFIIGSITARQKHQSFWQLSLAV